MISAVNALPYGPSPPKHWDVVPLKHLATLTNGLGFKSEDWRDAGTPIIRIENLNGSRRYNYTNLTVSEKYQVTAGDLLFAWSGNPGTSFGPFRWHAPGQFFLNQHIYKLSVYGCDKDWLFWALKAATHWIERELTSGMIGMVHVTKEDLGSVPIPIPPVEEQRHIARFLDNELAKVDTMAAKKLRLVSLLDEGIDSQILDLVGSSSLVRPDGRTPVLPVRKALKKVVRPARRDLETVTAYRDGQVTARSYRRPDGYTLSASTDPQGQFVEKGDVVIHGLDGFSGAIGAAEVSGNCSPVYHVCKTLNGGNPLFFGRLLRILAVHNYLGLFAVSTRERAVDFRNWDLFGRIPIPNAQLSEQDQIAARISHSRPLRESINRSNRLARERLDTLTMAAVTGQIGIPREQTGLEVG